MSCGGWGRSYRTLLGAKSLLRGNGETTSAPEFALPTPTTRPPTLSEENRPVSCSITWSNRKVPDKPVRIGTSCEIDGAVSEAAPTIPHRQEEEDCVGAGRRDLICAAMFVTSRSRDFRSGRVCLGSNGRCPGGRKRIRGDRVGRSARHRLGLRVNHDREKKHEQQTFHSGSPDVPYNYGTLRLLFAAAPWFVSRAACLILLSRRTVPR